MEPKGNIQVPCPECKSIITTGFETLEESFVDGVKIKCVVCNREILVVQGMLYKLAKIIPFPEGGKDGNIRKDPRGKE